MAVKTFVDCKIIVPHFFLFFHGDIVLFFSLFLDILEMLQMMLNNNQPINQYSPTYGIGFIKAGQQIEHMVGGWLYFPEKKI